MDEPGAPRTSGDADWPAHSRLRAALERRAEWVEGLIILATIATLFVVLGFLAIVAIPLAAVVQAFVVKYLEQYRAERGWPGPGDVLEQPPPDAPTATPA